MTQDPLKMAGVELELFRAVGRVLHDKPQQLVWGVAINIMVNAIRQSTAKRKDAEVIIDELFGHAKTLLLNVHYDSVTGLRRGVIPTQVIQMPFHDEGNVIYHGS